MKILKRMSSLVLCIILCFTIFVVPASAVTTIEYGDFTLAVNGDDTYSLYKYNGTSPYVAIPETANGLDIVAISSNCFTGSQAKYVLLNDNIKTIGNKAFYGAENLISITIPDSVTSIGNYAFAYCTSLSIVDFKDAKNLCSFPIGLFQGCTSLKNIQIPENITEINSDFLRDSGIESIVVPGSVTVLGPYAFSGCGSLTSVKLSENLTNIENYTFNGCTSLTQIIIPEGISSIGNRAFYGCSELKDVDIPLSCTSLGTKAFYDCTKLKVAFLSNNINAIGNECFYPMAYQKNLTIKCFADSYAEDYSYNNNIDYEIIDSSIGDVNLDGEISIKDVTTIQLHLADIATIDTSMTRGFADTNADNIVSLKDATIIQLYLAKYIDSL